MWPTIVIPFWHGHQTIHELLKTIPGHIPVIVVNDYGSLSPNITLDNVTVVSLSRRGYFSGACNRGFELAGHNDVLILNQDGKLLPGWERSLASREQYQIIGDGVMKHPAWPNGYVQGTFMYIARSVIDKIGGFNEVLYPLWGSTAEFQLRACRHGFKVQPIDIDPYYDHHRKGKAYGKAISRTLQEEPERKDLFIKTPPEISVIITTYNFKSYLEEAVNSVLEQTFQATEIIIVDDGSTDGTPLVAQRLQDPWKGIHYIRQRNQGASIAANAGIKIAKGRFITVLDGDDWMMPERLEKMYALASENPHSVVYDDMFWADTNGTMTERRMMDYDFEELLAKNSMHKGILFPKKAWLETGGYNGYMNDGREDWEFNIRLGLQGYCGVHCKEPLYVYRRQGQGRTEKNGLTRNYFLDKIQKLYPRVYFKGERPMACCGGKRSPTKTTSIVTTPVSRTVSTLTATAKAPADGWVLIEYRGTSIGNQTIYGQDTRIRYKYGRNPRNLRFWVDPRDIQFLLSTGEFQVYHTPPKRVEPVQEAVTEVSRDSVEDTGHEIIEETVMEAVEAIIESVSPQLVEEELPDDTDNADDPVAITARAQELADEMGIDIHNVRGTGVDGKITISDVRVYLAGM